MYLNYRNGVQVILNIKLICIKEKLWNFIELYKTFFEDIYMQFLSLLNNQISFTTSDPFWLILFFNFPTTMVIVIARITPPKTREITTNIVEFPEYILFPLLAVPAVKKNFELSHRFLTIQCLYKVQIYFDFVKS